MRVLTSGVKKLSADPLEARVAKSQILKHFQYVLLLLDTRNITT